jgi:putative ABC transport system substrate-binding protein
MTEGFMRRREFIALGAASMLGGIGLAPAGWAQQPGGAKRLGLLYFLVPAGTMPYTDPIRAGLKEQGFVDGANLTLDVRYGLNDLGVTRAAAHDLASRGYEVLLGAQTPSTAALVAETSTIPIVFGNVSDPIGSGFVQSLARPGGNVTGFSNVEASMGGAWLDILHKVAPGVRRAVLMFDPDVAPAGGNFFLPSFRAAASAWGSNPL